MIGIVDADGRGPVRQHRVRAGRRRRARARDGRRSGCVILVAAPTRGPATGAGRAVPIPAGAAAPTRAEARGDAERRVAASRARHDRASSSAVTVAGAVVITRPAGTARDHDPRRRPGRRDPGRRVARRPAAHRWRPGSRPAAGRARSADPAVGPAARRRRPVAPARGPRRRASRCCSTGIASAACSSPGMRGPGPGYAAWLDRLARPGAPARLSIAAGDRLVGRRDRDARPLADPRPGAAPSRPTAGPASTTCRSCCSATIGAAPVPAGRRRRGGRSTRRC